MTIASDLASGAQDESPESLLTFAKYLELSLDAGMCLVMMRRKSDVASLLIGEFAEEFRNLQNCGSINSAMADEILELTTSGMNQLTIGKLDYRFFRSFAHIAGVGAVVFSPA
jgi:hypothetical protein